MVLCAAADALRLSVSSSRNTTRLPPSFNPESAGAPNSEAEPTLLTSKNRESPGAAQETVRVGWYPSGRTGLQLTLDPTAGSVI